MANITLASHTPMAQVLLLIDPLHDFMSRDGAFALVKPVGAGGLGIQLVGLVVREWIARAPRASSSFRLRTKKGLRITETENRLVLVRKSRKKSTQRIADVRRWTVDSVSVANVPDLGSDLTGLRRPRAAARSWCAARRAQHGATEATL